MRLSVDDFGFRQGVTVVERLRTYAGVVFALETHLDRWQSSNDVLGIQGLPTSATTRSLVRELLDRNREVVQAEHDIGITMFSTPGELGGNTPTFGLHLNRLDQARIDRYRRRGQPLVVTNVRQPDPACWPRSIKVRSRIHYYLADESARCSNPDAVGVLVDDDGSVTETSIANLAIVKSCRIVSPPADRVLGGVTQAVVESLAAEAEFSWTKRAIPVAEFLQADEILMMGTDGGIWFARSVDGESIAGGKAGTVLANLRERFDALVLGGRSG